MQYKRVSFSHYSFIYSTVIYKPLKESLFHRKTTPNIQFFFFFLTKHGQLSVLFFLSVRTTLFYKVVVLSIQVSLRSVKQFFVFNGHTIRFFCLFICIKIDVSIVERVIREFQNFQKSFWLPIYNHCLEKNTFVTIIRI